jgi:membrane protein YqaA with SNARE-associated domain
MDPNIVEATLAADPAIEPNEIQKFGWKHVLSLSVAVAATAGIVLFYDKLGSFQHLAYGGAFLAMLIGNATVILPVPGLIVIYVLGGTLNPLLLGLAAGPGAALGEMTGYFAGYGGSALIDNMKLYHRIRGWMERYGLLVIVLLSAIPNPVFDMAGIVAGSLRLKWWQFLLAAWIGKTIQALLIAYAGALSIGWVQGLLN